MKSSPAKFVVLTLILLLYEHTFSQSVKTPAAAYLNFSSITIKEGLSQGMINYMLQDYLGFTWFATKDGLNRYDGYRFVVYKHDAFNATSIADNHVRCLYEDSKRRLWVGTENNGVDIFDRNSEKFFHIRKSEKKSNSINDNRINNIAEDAAGNIWVSTGNGISIVSFKVRGNKTDTIISTIDLYKSAENKTIVYTSASDAMEQAAVLFNDSRHAIWIFSAGSGYKIFYETGVVHVERVQIPRWNILVPADYDIVSHAEDIQHGFLYLVSNTCVFRYNQQDRKFDVLDIRNYSRNVISVQSAVADDGTIWLTNLGRLYTIDFNSGKIWQIYYANNRNVVNGGCNVYRDRNGIIWVGTAGYGIVKHVPLTARFHYISYNSISGMTEVLPDKLNVAGSVAKGELFDLQSGEFIPAASLLNGLLEHLQPLNELDKFWFNGRHCVIARGCLWWCDTLTGSIRKIKQLSDQPRVIKEKNGAWIGDQDSIYYFDENEPRLYSYAYPVTPKSVPYNFCMDVAKDGLGNLWLATMRGLLCFNTGTKKWKIYNHSDTDTSSISSDILFSLCADPVEPGKYIWAGTEGEGLNKVDIQTGYSICFREHDGLPNSVIYGIVADDNKTLWMSTNKGIASYNTATGTFTNYEEADGLQGNEFNRYAFGKSSGGWIFFGGINGFNYFKPAALHVDTVFSKVIFTDFRISNKSVDFTAKNAPLSRPVFLTDRIQLPYRDNMISFDFASVNLSQPEKNYYQYKLKGFDEGWIQAGKVHSATYTNLDPGTYTFYVRCSNYANAWGNDATSIQLVIVPPWYMTWWFRVALICGVAAGIYALYRYRLSQALKLQSVRNKIAADLHDEIGSTLSSISIFSQVIENQVQDKSPSVVPVVRRINESTVNMMEAMSDIVWAINPANDRFENVISRIQSFAAEILEAVNCKLQVMIDEKASSVKLGMEVRKNVFLFLKEAVNNISKYAKATNAVISIHVKQSALYIAVADDGIGFDRNRIKPGNGLLNMEKRAAELKGQLSIESTPGKGTHIQLVFAL